MGKYAKISRQSSKNIDIIDQLFYRQFKRQMCGDNKIERVSHKANKRKLKRQLKSIRKSNGKVEMI